MLTSPTWVEPPWFMFLVSGLTLTFPAVSLALLVRSIPRNDEESTSDEVDESHIELTIEDGLLRTALLRGHMRVHRKETPIPKKSEPQAETSPARSTRGS